MDWLTRASLTNLQAQASDAKRVEAEKAVELADLRRRVSELEQTVALLVTKAGGV